MTTGGHSGSRAPGRTAAGVPTRRQHFADRRRGAVLLKVVIAVAMCAALGYLFLFLPGTTGDQNDFGEVLVHIVEEADFESVVTETGDIESASNDEVRCEVKSTTGSAGTTILKVVDEGTVVKKGEFLVQFDDAALKLRLTEREIQVATDEALVIQAQSDHATAVETLGEYRDGLFLVDKETIESEVLDAQTLLRRAEGSLEHTQRMFRKGFVPRLTLEAEQEAVAMARKVVQVAGTKLKVLMDFTRGKTIRQYTADIKKQRAILTATEHTLKLSQDRRDDLAQQIENCEVKAPSDGRVVYANDYRREFVIEEGAQVREGQIIIRLPDPTQMQVKTNINDSQVKKVRDRIGTPVRIVLDVDPDLPIEGELVKVEPFAYPQRWHGAPIEYGALVRVINPPSSMQPKQRVRVHIEVERQQDVLQAPVTSVVEREGKHYCLVKDEAGNWKPRSIAVGANNDSFVVVEGGLKVGDKVALNPDLLWDAVVGDDFPGSAARATTSVAVQPSGRQ